jgi:hypothetical protein
MESRFSDPPTDTESSMVRRVDGSSPSEGSAKAPQDGASSFGCTCTIHSVRWVWSTPEKWDSGARVSPETSRGSSLQKAAIAAGEGADLDAVVEDASNKPP